MMALSIQLYILCVPWVQLKRDIHNWRKKHSPLFMVLASFIVTYLYGRIFLLYSDHKPLIHIFEELKSVPVMASWHLQRWALTLSSYTYTIKYKSGNNQGNADALSHTPLPEFAVTTSVPAETITSIECVSSIPITAAKAKQQTDQDPILCKVKHYTQQGWPVQLNSGEASDLKPFFHHKSELSLKDGIFMG